MFGIDMTHKPEEMTPDEVLNAEQRAQTWNVQPCVWNEVFPDRRQ